MSMGFSEAATHIGEGIVAGIYVGSVGTYAVRKAFNKEITESAELDIISDDTPAYPKVVDSLAADDLL